MNPCCRCKALLVKQRTLITRKKTVSSLLFDCFKVFVRVDRSHELCWFCEGGASGLGLPLSPVTDRCVHQQGVDGIAVRHKEVAEAAASHDSSSMRRSVRCLI